MEVAPQLSEGEDSEAEEAQLSRHIQRHSRSALFSYSPPRKRRRLCDFPRSFLSVESSPSSDIAMDGSSESDSDATSEDLFYPGPHVIGQDDSSPQTAALSKMTREPRSSMNPVKQLPSSLREILRSTDGPAVVIEYRMNSHNIDGNYATCLPLLCTYPGSQATPATNPSIYGRERFVEIDFPNIRSDKELDKMTNETGKTGPPASHAETHSQRKTGPNDSSLTMLNNHSRDLDQSFKKTMPLNTKKIPTEIFEHIAEYLTRADMCNLRLVDRAFERGISARMFDTIVVPFNTEIYGVLSASQGENRDHTDIDLLNHSHDDRDDLGIHMTRNDGSNPIPNVSSRHSGKNLDVFGGFGPHIRRFGISFDVCEKTLLNPPSKALQKSHTTYWGTYDWPYQCYRRFRDRAGLELTADETSTMKLAFSHLKAARHLALSLDTGLGWRNGGDISIFGKLLHAAPAMFESSNRNISGTVKEQRNLWLWLEENYKDADVLDDLKCAGVFRIQSSGGYMKTSTDNIVSNDMGILSKWIHQSDELGSDGRLANIESRVDYASRLDRSEMTFYQFRHMFQQELSRPFHQSPRRSPANFVENTCLSPYHTEAVARTSRTTEEYDTEKAVPEAGMICIRPLRKKGEFLKSSENSSYPRKLTRSQKEWLLETAWAQDAFLSSYMLAVVDNQPIFQQVVSLKVSRISSRHLSKLSRKDFWKALPNLKTLDMRVIPDWRDVRRNQDGLVDTPWMDPSEAVDPFHTLLKTVLSRKESIESLCFGWADGGEHADGQFARNKNILPAPLVTRREMRNVDENFTDILTFPHLETLKLVNCWLTPNLLTKFIKIHKHENLRGLILESFSLTTHPRFPIRNAAQQAAAVGQNQFPPPLATQQMAQLNAQIQNPGVQVPAANAPGIAQQQPNGGNPVVQNQAPANGFAQMGLNQPGQAQAPAAMGHNPTAQVHPDSGHREGSWPHVLSDVSEAYRHLKTHSLEITFRSCGYVRLRTVNFDQAALDSAASIQPSENLPPSLEHFFSQRMAMMKDSMMYSTDSLLGAIAIAIPRAEIGPLKHRWSLEEGWPSAQCLDSDYNDEEGFGTWGAKTQEAAEYDGMHKGGTGRFSGKITGFARALSTKAAEGIVN